MEKKLVKSRDVVFMENQTIQDILKTDTLVPQCSDGLIDLDPIPLTHVPTEVRDVQDDQHDIGDVDTDSTPVEMGDNAHEQSPISKVPLEVLSDVPFRRFIRDRQPSTRYSTDEYVLLTDEGKPKCYAEAMEDENKKEWVDAMQDEMKSLYENSTFELVKLPKGKRALKNMWVYKVKQEEHTSQLRYKARLVVKGFS